MVKSLLSFLPHSVYTRLRALWQSFRNNAYKRISYSQCGEDLLLADLMVFLHIKNPTYLDIGACYPIYLSNTYYFYKRGNAGVCVEPNPVLSKAYQAKRARDTVLPVGISINADTHAPYYMFDAATLNTFSKSEAEACAKKGYPIERCIEIPLININALIEQHFAHTPRKAPDIVSLDVEGLDLQILQTLNFSQHRPLAICVETLDFTTNKKRPDISTHLTQNGYVVYADTYLNTIFVDEKEWLERKR